MKIPKKTVAAVLLRDGFRCVIAGPFCLGEATLADHRANRGNGGSKVLNIPENLIAACGLCNGGKEDADGDYVTELISRGIRIKKPATNAQAAQKAIDRPVLYADGWHYLVGVNRVPGNKHTAVEYMVLIGAIETGYGLAY